MSYEPRGYPKAAIDHLATLPPGTWLSSAELAEAIDVRPPSQLISLLEYPVRHGLLLKAKDPHDQRRNIWALGDGTPLPQPTDDDDGEEGDPPGRAATATTAAKKRRSTASRAVLVNRPALAGLRVALYSDGVLQIERGAEIFTLDADETRTLVRYLDRLAPQEAPQC